MWLLKHVAARGRLVHILPQEGQGNLDFWEIIVVGATTGVAGDVIVGMVMGVDADNGAAGFGGVGLVVAFHINGG
jgi:hypothetical protein